MLLFARKDGMDMTTGPFLKKLVMFSIPVMMTGVLQLLYNSADLIVVGQFSSSAAQGAIQSTASLIHLIVNVSLGLSVGINVAVAKNIGAKDGKAVSLIIHTAVTVALIIGVGIGLFGVIFSKTFLGWMNSPEDVIDLSALYLKIYFLGTPLNLLYNFGAAALRANGETQKPLLYLFVSGAVNVILNLFFVVVLKMDVDGVAIATVSSQALSAVLVVIELCKTKGYCKLYLNKLHIHVPSLLEILKIGLPAGIQGSMFSISNVILQSTINSYGSTVVTANGNATSVEAFINVAVDSVYQACISFLGQNYGANKKQNVKRVMILTLVLVNVLCIVLAGMIIPLKSALLSIYNTDPEIIALGEKRLMINVTTYFIFGCMQVFVAYLRGLGHGLLPVILSILGICVFRVIWIFAVYPLSPSLEMLYLSYPISWIITAAAHLVAYFAVRKRTFIKMNEEYQARFINEDTPSGEVA